MCQVSPLRLDNLRLEQLPFPHLAIKDAIDAAFSEKLLTWMESTALWEDRHIDDFYDLCQVNLLEADLPGELSVLRSPELLSKIRADLTRAFRTHFATRIEVSAHKLISGNRIGIHTDLSEKCQSHRLLLQLNRGWDLKCGGLLLLMDQKSLNQPSVLHKYYAPQNRSAVAFEISDRSFHGVSTVHSGERYTLAFTLYPDRAQSRTPDSR